MQVVMCFLCLLALPLASGSGAVACTAPPATCPCSASLSHAANTTGTVQRTALSGSPYSTYYVKYSPSSSNEVYALMTNAYHQIVVIKLFLQYVWSAVLTFPSYTDIGYSFTPDGQRLIYPNQNAHRQCIFSLNTATGQLNANYVCDTNSAHVANVKDITVASDSIAYATRPDYTPTLISFDTNSPETTVRAVETNAPGLSSARFVLVFPGGHHILVVPASDNRLYRVSTATNLGPNDNWELLATVPGHSAAIQGIAVSPDAATIFLSTSTHFIYALRMSDLLLVQMTAGPGSSTGASSLSDLKLNDPRGLTVSPDGYTLMVVDHGNNNFLKITICDSSCVTCPASSEADDAALPSTRRVGASVAWSPSDI